MNCRWSLRFCWCTHSLEAGHFLWTTKQKLGVSDADPSPFSKSTDMTAEQEEMTQNMELKLPEMVNESAQRNCAANHFPSQQCRRRQTRLIYLPSIQNSMQNKCFTRGWKKPGLLWSLWQWKMCLYDCDPQKYRSKLTSFAIFNQYIVNLKSQCRTPLITIVNNIVGTATLAKA